MKKVQMQQRVENFVDDILIEYEPEELEEAGEQLQTLFTDYLESTMTAQRALDRDNVRKVRQ